MAHGNFGFISVIQLIWIFRKNHEFPWLWIWKPMNFHDYEFVSREFSMTMNMKSHEFPWIRKKIYELYEYEFRDIFNYSWSSYELYEPRIKTPSRNSILHMKLKIFQSPPLEHTKSKILPTTPPNSIIPSRTGPPQKIQNPLVKDQANIFRNLKTQAWIFWRIACPRG